jgi:NADPH2:quinone reductase
VEGAQVTGISRNPQRVKSLLQAGDVQIVSDIATVRGSFDLILESVGGESLTAALRLVGRDGIVAMFGNSSGQDSRVAFQQFSGRAHARLYAFFVYESGEPPTFGQDLGVMAQEIGAGQLHPQIGMEANWRDPLGALTALRERAMEGKAVLLIRLGLSG